MLDAAPTLPERLKEYVDDYREVASHRSHAFGPEPLIETLEAYDRMLGIEREAYQKHILLTLDLIERSERASAAEKRNKQQTNAHRH